MAPPPLPEGPAVVVVVAPPPVVGVVVVVTEQTWSPSCLQRGRISRLQVRRDFPLAATHSATNGLQAFRHFFTSPAVAGTGMAASAVTIPMIAHSFRGRDGLPVETEGRGGAIDRGWVQQPADPRVAT
jgi:hypothetical protein